MHGRHPPFGSEPMSALEAISLIPEAEGTHNTAFNYEGMLKRVSFMRIHGTLMPGPLSHQPTPLVTSACVAALPALFPVHALIPRYWDGRDGRAQRERKKGGRRGPLTALGQVSVYSARTIRRCQPTLHILHSTTMYAPGIYNLHLVAIFCFYSRYIRAVDVPARPSVNWLSCRARLQKGRGYLLHLESPDFNFLTLTPSVPLRPCGGPKHVRN